nr:MAG: hypothetical protein DIU78_07525 [Pseudomonadota bacterium]
MRRGRGGVCVLFESCLEPRRNARRDPQRWARFANRARSAFSGHAEYVPFREMSTKMGRNAHALLDS